MNGPVGYSVAGPSDAPTIILLHGVFFDKGMWQAPAARLSTRFQVVSIDLPGHGDLRDRPFSLAAAISWLREVVQKTDPHPVAIVGLSLGGYVAMAAIAQDPGLAGALVLTGASREPGAFLRGPLRRLFRLLQHVPETIADPIARLGVRLTCPPQVANVLRLSGPWVRQGFHALSVLPSSGYLNAIAGIYCPILILNGRRDPISRPGQRAFLAACRFGRLEILEHVGHLAPLQAPDAYVATVVAFIDEAAEARPRADPA